ncbi:MAG: helix-turn-helix domain-containing protein [Mucilaginibacter polytrichastri]|nr:helix-turn-helix domain-containing protein [Mucilaginibacter polytrichastri]
MQKDILLQISNRIKEKRKEQNITVQELADRAKVSKGLISQIENSRTVPSLLVLVNIVRALDIDLNIFFKDIGVSDKQPAVLHLRKKEYEAFEKEDASGFHYQRVLTENMQASTVDVVLLELEPGATRPMVQTEAFEYKYLVNGKVVYHFDHEDIVLEAGDSIFFDGRIPHTPENLEQHNALMLVMYFFEEKTQLN